MTQTLYCPKCVDTINEIVGLLTDIDIKVIRLKSETIDKAQKHESELASEIYNRDHIDIYKSDRRYSSYMARSLSYNLENVLQEFKNLKQSLENIVGLDIS